MRTNIIQKCYRHFLVITRHKWEVFKLCWKAGLYWQGITHDLSKYSFAEFIEYAHYFQGTSSPVDAAKREKGFCFAWQHHKGRNPHHYEFWVDNLDGGGVPLIMPYKYAVEMLCDWIGAGKVYNAEKWTIKEPFEYFKNKIKGRAKIHPLIINFLEIVLQEYAEVGNSIFADNKLKVIYNKEINQPMRGKTEVIISQPMRGKTEQQIREERAQLVSELTEKGYEVLDISRH